MFRTFLLVLIMMGICRSASAEEQRYALIIGNEAYPPSVGALTHPHEDAAVIRDALLASGFSPQNITLLSDADKGDILGGIVAFTSALRAAGKEGVGFFYYSGHGGSAQISTQRQNYLIPSDVAITSAENLPLLGVSVSDIVDSLAATDAKAVFAVFDACRDTLPLASSTKGSVSDKGMIRLPRTTGMFIAFATADGQTAPDDGLFSKSLAAQMRTPGLTADRVFTLTSRGVVGQRPGAALPFFSDGLAEDFCFADCSAETGRVTTVAPPPAAEPFDITQLPAEYAEIVRQARENKAVAERYAAQGEKVRELAEQAASKAREVSSGRAVNGYSTYKATNGNSYAGQVAEQNGMEKSDGFGVSVTGPGDAFGTTYYCRFILDVGCFGSGVIEYGVNKANSAELESWTGEIGPKGQAGWGHVEWVSKNDSKWPTEAWVHVGTAEAYPSVWAWSDGRRYEGEIRNSFNGKGVFWRSDGTVQMIGIWKDGNPVEDFTEDWRTGKLK